MKYFILSLCLFMSLNLYGQRKKKSDATHFIKLQGGLLYDSHPSNDYTGFGIFNIGWMKAKENILQGIELDFVNYESDLQSNESPVTGSRTWAMERTSFELVYFRSRAIIGDIENGLFIGPAASYGYVDRELIPSTATSFPIQDKCSCFGIGFKADYLLNLSQRLYLNISSRLTVFDMALIETEIKNPILSPEQRRFSNFEFDFIRNQFPFMVGLAIKL